MAKRQNNNKIDTKHLQGEGSYIILKALTVDQWNQRQKLVAESNKVIGDETRDPEERKRILQDNERQLNAIHAQLVIAWDWVDDDDKPLPLPSSDPDVWQRLTMREVSFIIEHIEKSATEQKKDETKSPTSS